MRAQRAWDEERCVGIGLGKTLNRTRRMLLLPGTRVCMTRANSTNSRRAASVGRATAVLPHHRRWSWLAPRAGQPPMLVALTLLVGTTPPPCTQCDAGRSCNMCLRKLRHEECPPEVEGTNNGGLPSCTAGSVEPGRLCEADGPCDTSQLTNNCAYSGLGLVSTFDIYLRVDCTLQPMPPPSPPFPPSPPSSPPPPPPPALPSCEATQCDAGSECGMCLRLVSEEECPGVIVGTVNGGLPPCEPHHVDVGQLCEGDGPCGTSEARDNCKYGESGFFTGTHVQKFDVYVRAACAVTPHPPPLPPSTPAPPMPPPMPHPPAFPDCGHCDAGAECGYCLRKLRADECPHTVTGSRDGGYHPCRSGRVEPGMICEGDGPCGTSDVTNNCAYSASSFPLADQISYDLYLREACTLAPHAPPSPPPPPSPPAPPALPPPPALPACDPNECHAGRECGYCLRRLDRDECPHQVRGSLNGGLPGCKPGEVEPGQLCEGDGPCGTAEVLDNCEYGVGFGQVQPFDFYVRVACDTHTDAPSTPPAPPPSPPPSPHPPHAAGEHPDPMHDMDSYDEAVQDLNFDPYDGLDSSEDGRIIGADALNHGANLGANHGANHDSGHSHWSLTSVVLVLGLCACGCYCGVARAASPRGPLAAGHGPVGMRAANEGSRPWRWNDVTYKLAAMYSHVNLMREEAANFNLLSADGRRGFASCMHAHQLAREKEEDEDLQEML